MRPSAPWNPQRRGIGKLSRKGLRKPRDEPVCSVEPTETRNSEANQAEGGNGNREQGAARGDFRQGRKRQSDLFSL